MPRNDVTQDKVLWSVVSRLRDLLTLDERRCYETIEPLAPRIVPAGGPFWITVAPGEGRFVEGEQAPGNFTEEWSVVVTIYTRIHLDSLTHDSKLLRDEARGLLNLKRRVLDALVAVDLETEDEDQFLRQLLFAKYCSRPQYDDRPEQMIGWLQIEFGVHFDWFL